MPDAPVLPGPLPSSVTMSSKLNMSTFNSLATTNATIAKASPGVIYELSLTNYSATTRYFKLYNKASAPTVGTDVPALTITVNANSERVLAWAPEGKFLSAGIAFAITNLQPFTDTTAVAAGSVVASLTWA